MALRYFYTHIEIAQFAKKNVDLVLNPRIFRRVVHVDFCDVATMFRT